MPEIREYTPARSTPSRRTSRARSGRRDRVVHRGVRRHLLGDPIVMPDGRIGHAELRVGDTVFMLAGEFPEENHRSPRRSAAAPSG